jgi:hypothetical protein
MMLSLGPVPDREVERTTSIVWHASLLASGWSDGYVLGLTGEATRALLLASLSGEKWCGAWLYLAGEELRIGI